MSLAHTLFYSRARFFIKIIPSPNNKNTQPVYKFIRADNMRLVKKPINKIRDTIKKNKPMINFNSVKRFRIKRFSEKENVQYNGNQQQQQA
jgi:hypothetical protein